MNKIYLLLLTSLLFISEAQAQLVDCSSGRFDTEVFSGFDTTLNVTYGANLDYNGLNTVLTMDIYQPEGDTMSQRPLIVWVHGGSFLSGTKNDLDVQRLSEHFSKRGYVCASINYRLGISFPYNEANTTSTVFRAVQDLKAAIRFFRKDAATANEYKIDPNIIFAGGSSAGAFTALHLAYLNEYSELPSTIDTSILGDIEGNSGNPGYSSEVNAVVDLCGALGNKTWMKVTDVPVVTMHGTADAVVPYATAIINLLGVFPIMQVDGSYSISAYADSIGIANQMYTYFGADHVPYYSNLAYMDTTVRFVSNFLYSQLGCTPSDPNPLPNTFNLNTAVKEIDRSFEMYPNPATSDLVLELKNSSEKISSVRIYDLLGKEVLSQKTNSSKSIIDVSFLSQGSYFVSIQIGERVEVRKLVRN